MYFLCEVVKWCMLNCVLIYCYCFVELMIIFSSCFERVLVVSLIVSAWERFVLLYFDLSFE